MNKVEQDREAEDYFTWYNRGKSAAGSLNEVIDKIVNRFKLEKESFAEEAFFDGLRDHLKDMPID